MKIVFWSPMHGTGATANMLAITLAIAGRHDSKILMTQTHYAMNNLEGPLVGELDGRRESEYWRDTGIDAVIRYFKSGMLSREIMNSCAIDLTDRLSLLTGTRQSSKQTYDDDILRRIVSRILDTAEDYYDFVTIDTNSGYSSTSIDTVRSADVVIVTLRQNIDMINELFENEKFKKLDPKRIFYLFGSYDAYSKYNLGNIRRMYRRINSRNSGGLPHCTAYMDALCDNRALRYISSNLVAEEYGDSEFFRALCDVSERITSLALRLKE